MKNTFERMPESFRDWYQKNVTDGDESHIQFYLTRTGTVIEVNDLGQVSAAEFIGGEWVSETFGV